MHDPDVTEEVFVEYIFSINLLTNKFLMFGNLPFFRRKIEAIRK